MKIYILIIFYLTTLLSPLYGEGKRLSTQNMSDIRGFNYQPARSKGMGDFFANYIPSETEFDMALAERLQLSHVRFFIGYNAYVQDKGLLKANLIHFCHTCAAHKIKCMPVVNYPVSWGRADYSKAEGLAAYLVETLSGQPNLVCLDVANEPDNGRTREFTKQRIELARHMARTFKKLAPETPVTIGFAREESMENHGDVVDVLSYHDYADTRKGIQSAIVRAKAYGAKMGKPVVCTEIGCIARANPYDIALEEYMRARIGWFIWELMITRAWGDVHGIFYADGTIRDTAAVAALSGFFRNRSASVVTVVPDRENKVTRRVKNIKYWLGRTDGTWEEMLDLAESCANLIEAAELAPFHDLPTRQVELLRLGNPDMQKLRTLLAQYLLILEKYKTGNYLTRKTQVNYNGGE